jgi:hypothetical protein
VTDELIKMVQSRYISTCVLIVRFFYMLVDEHSLACYRTAMIEKLRNLSLRITKNLIT